ncbi:MAG: hypothetical protein ACRDIV_11175 [Ktedonobacteraceae bacterium]
MPEARVANPVFHKETRGLIEYSIPGLSTQGTANHLASKAILPSRRKKLPNGVFQELVLQRLASRSYRAGVLQQKTTNRSKNSQ